MSYKLFHQWIRQIYTTQDEELDCDEFLDTIPQYVDVEIAGGATNPHFPKVEIHLGHCPECQDLYLTLRDVALLEDQQTVLEDQQAIHSFSSELATDGIPRPDSPSSVTDSPLHGRIP